MNEVLTLGRDVEINDKADSCSCPLGVHVSEHGDCDEGTYRKLR